MSFSLQLSFTFFVGCLRPGGPTTATSDHISWERAVSLFWNTLRGAVTILAQTAETEDVHVGTVPTMEHLAIF